MIQRRQPRRNDPSTVNASTALTRPTQDREAAAAVVGMAAKSGKAKSGNKDESAGAGMTLGAVGSGPDSAVTSEVRSGAMIDQTLSSKQRVFSATAGNRLGSELFERHSIVLNASSHLQRTASSFLSSFLPTQTATLLQGAPSPALISVEARPVHRETAAPQEGASAAVQAVSSAAGVQSVPSTSGWAEPAPHKGSASSTEEISGRLSPVLSNRVQPMAMAAESEQSPPVTRQTGVARNPEHNPVTSDVSTQSSAAPQQGQRSSPVYLPSEANGPTETASDAPPSSAESSPGLQPPFPAQLVDQHDSVQGGTMNTQTASGGASVVVSPNEISASPRMDSATVHRTRQTEAGSTASDPRAIPSRSESEPFIRTTAPVGSPELPYLDSVHSPERFAVRSSSLQRKSGLEAQSAPRHADRERQADSTLPEIKDAGGTGFGEEKPDISRNRAGGSGIAQISSADQSVPQGAVSHEVQVLPTMPDHRMPPLTDLDVNQEARSASLSGRNEFQQTSLPTTPGNRGHGGANMGSLSENVASGSTAETIQRSGDLTRGTQDPQHAPQIDFRPPSLKSANPRSVQSRPAADAFRPMSLPPMLNRRIGPAVIQRIGHTSGKQEKGNEVPSVLARTWQVGADIRYPGNGVLNKAAEGVQAHTPEPLNTTVQTRGNPIPDVEPLMRYRQDSTLPERTAPPIIGPEKEESRLHSSRFEFDSTLAPNSTGLNLVHPMLRSKNRGSATGIQRSGSNDSKAVSPALRDGLLQPPVLRAALHSSPTVLLHRAPVSASAAQPPLTAANPVASSSAFTGNAASNQSPVFSLESSAAGSKVDLPKLADEVYHLLIRRLASERERRGV